MSHQPLPDPDQGASRRSEERLGPYVILQELGRGGQGVVYLAEDTRLGRRVALKVLTGWGALSIESLARFQREAGVVARLDHPGICSIYETGTAQGTPYMAMRFVEGQTLQELIRSARARTRLDDGTVFIGMDDEDVTVVEEARPASRSPSRQEIDTALRVIEKAAKALHAAHEAGVVHRDVKPGNIMVTADGDPVVLDFGLAREMDDQTPTLTASGAVCGTPVYMSPEQTRGTRGLDPRTDVYSLGATLYEVLTLERPFEGATRERLFDAINHRAPVDPRRLNRAISRDLKVVLQTAMEKSPDRRYQTAADFAEDLARVSRREPVRARPIAPGVRLSRWAQRNPWLAGTSCVLALTIIGALGITLDLLRRTRVALDGERVAKQAVEDSLGRERTAREESDAVTTFLEDALASVSPDHAGHDVTMREFLDEGAASLAKTFENQPGVLARLEHTVGRTYWALGDAKEALAHLRAAIELRLAVVGPDSPDVADSRYLLAIVLHGQGFYEEAEEQVRRSLAILERAGETESTRLAGFRTLLGQLAYNRGRFDEALELHQDALAMRRRVLGDDDLDVAGALSALAFILGEADRAKEAEPLIREAERIIRTRLGVKSARRVRVLNDLGLIAKDLGKLDEAQRTLEESLAIAREIYPEGHVIIADTLWRLGIVLERRGNTRGAEPPLREALDIRRAALGSSHRDVATAAASLGGVFRSERRFDDARLLLQEALDIRRRVFGPEHVAVASSVEELGTLARREGRLAEAEERLREALALWRRTVGEEARPTLDCLNLLALVLQDQKDYVGAKAAFSTILDVLRRRHPEGDDALLARAMNNLGSLCFRKKDMDEAEALLTSALAMRRRVFEPGHPDLTESLGNVAFLLENLGRVAEAEPLHREFLASYRSLPAVHAAIGGAVRGLAANLGKQGKWREAETVLRDRLAAIEGLVPETDPEWYRTAARLGHVLSRGENKEEAERLLTRGYDLCLEGRHQDSTMVAGWLAELLDGLGRKEEAAVWSARARPVVGQ